MVLKFHNWKYRKDSIYYFCDKRSSSKFRSIPYTEIAELFASTRGKSLSKNTLYRVCNRCFITIQPSDGHSLLNKIIAKQIIKPDAECEDLNIIHAYAIQKTCSFLATEFLEENACLLDTVYEYYLDTAKTIHCQTYAACTKSDVCWQLQKEFGNDLIISNLSNCSFPLLRWKCNSMETALHKSLLKQKSFEEGQSNELKLLTNQLSEKCQAETTDSVLKRASLFVRQFVKTDGAKKHS